MAEKTEDKLVKAIETLAGKISDSTKPDEALKFTQAALNAAHAIQVIKGSQPLRNKIWQRDRTKP